jgi:hypothetical protein
VGKFGTIKKKEEDEWEGTSGKNFLMSWTKQLGKLSLGLDKILVAR